MDYHIEQSAAFAKWLYGLKDQKTKARIMVRIQRMSIGHFGEHRQLDDDLFELKMKFGAGYRVYYAFEGESLILLLRGGDKSSQSKDIKKACEILRDWRNEHE